MIGRGNRRLDLSPKAWCWTLVTNATSLVCWVSGSYKGSRNSDCQSEEDNSPNSVMVLWSLALFSFFLTPTLTQKSQIYSHTTHSLCVLSSTALIYLLLHSSQHLWDCYLTPLCFLSTFSNFVLVLLFYLSDLIQFYSLKVQASYEVSHLFQKGDSCWERNRITTCCYRIWM